MLVFKHLPGLKSEVLELAEARVSRPRERRALASTNTSSRSIRPLISLTSRRFLEGSAIKPHVERLYLAFN